MAPMGDSVESTEGGASRGARPLPLSTNTITRRTSLLLDEGLALEDWMRIGTQLSRTQDSSTWWLGDWLVYGQARYPERYRRVIDATAFDYQTLRNYAWVANRVSPQRRRARLSFQHHAEVAPLAGPEQERWLTLAEENGWSRNRLRAELRSARRGEGADLGASEAEEGLRLRLENERLGRWQQAASQAGQELLQWMTEHLDQAASGGG
jgi:hypothetical protein